MAAIILLPNADGSSHADWVVVGSGLTERWEALVDDNGATSYVKCSTNLRNMVIEFQNPSDIGVAEADIDFNETVSVQFLSSGKSAHRSSPSLVNIEFEAPTANQFPEVCSYDVHRTNFETINGTPRETHDGTHTWTYANLEALEMECTKNLGTEIYLSYLALEVTYTEAVSADNATFFGANF